MTGKEFKIQLKAQRLQEKSEGILVNFLKKHIEDGLIFDDIWNMKSWIEEIYPDIMDESEEDENMISAFMAGIIHILINAQDCGVRWIQVYHPPENEEEEDTDTKN